MYDTIPKSNCRCLIGYDGSNVYVYRSSLGIEELKSKLFAEDAATWSCPFLNNDVMEVMLSLGAIE